VVISGFQWRPIFLMRPLLHPRCPQFARQHLSSAVVHLNLNDSTPPPPLFTSICTPEPLLHPRSSRFACQHLSSAVVHLDFIVTPSFSLVHARFNASRRGSPSFPLVCFCFNTRKRGPPPSLIRVHFNTRNGDPPPSPSFASFSTPEEGDPP